jgi:2-succinyl-5-enolpyruvyl-6-hydroxy-3-cyclohexene-1-carboxylate synthase
VPLVVLTADRPPELRDRGASQTIDQVHLYGRSAKWFAELPLLDGEGATLAHWRWVAGRAVAVAGEGPAGPVHVNLPFREPLLPDASLVADPSVVPPERPFADVVTGPRRLGGADLDRLAERLASARRGLIVAGPDDDPGLPPALADLARVTGFPILADPLSGLRTGPHDRSRVIAHGDQLARPGPWIDAHQPDLVLRTGAVPTSKPVLELLAGARAELVILDGDGGFREAALVPATYVHADATATVLALVGHPAVRVAQPIQGWTADWTAADRTADVAMTDWLEQLELLWEPFEGSPWPILADALPDGGMLWAASSMPVRDLDAWLPSTDRAITVRSNRGANGIDGVISTALGSAAVSDGPVAVVVGDIAFLHDLNALVAARLHDLSATIVLVNNDGGGIFSFLPQAQPGTPVEGSGLPKHYEELFGTPHGIGVGPAVEALGGTHRVLEPGDLDPAIRDSIGRPGVQVLELRTERARNLALHREVAAVVQRSLAGRDG